MSETTGPQRAAFAYMINKGQGVYVGDVPRTGLRSLLNDADRLTAIEREVRELAELWDQQQSEYPNTQEGEVAAAAVRCCARELRAILDPEAK